MDNLDKIIKQKAENFEIPFNEIHWTEMEGKLNAIRSKKIRSLLLGSASIITALSIPIYILFPFAPATTIKSNIKNSVEKTSASGRSSTQNSITVFPKNKPTKEPLEEQIKTRKEKVVVIKEKTITPSEKTIDKTLSILEKNSEIKKLPPTITKEKTVRIETKKVLNKIETATPSSNKNSISNTDQRKSVKHRIYKDENVSKKSVKRSRRSSFFNFKRKYKLTIPKKAKKSN